MSHRCGPNCRRKQNPSTRAGCPTCGSRRKLSGGGKVRNLSRHFLRSLHPEITRRVVTHVLDNWVLKGFRTEPDGRSSWIYLAYSPSLGKMVRVVVSSDDTTIVSAFQDRTATKAWEQGNRLYFERHYESLEVRDEPKDTV